MADRLTLILPTTYAALLEELRSRILSARQRAVAAANREFITLYFDIGRSIVERQQAEHWGSGVIDRLAADLPSAFPEMEAFSPRNLRRMRAFYLAWRAEEAILPQAVAELPWGHNAVLLEKLAEPVYRRWYAERAIERGWSRAMLTSHIVGRLHQREGMAISNFAGALPPPASASRSNRPETRTCSTSSRCTTPRTSGRSRTLWWGSDLAAGVATALTWQQPCSR